MASLCFVTLPLSLLVMNQIKRWDISTQLFFPSVSPASRADPLTRLHSLKTSYVCFLSDSGTFWLCGSRCNSPAGAPHATQWIQAHFCHFSAVRKQAGIRERINDLSQVRLNLPLRSQCTYLLVMDSMWRREASLSAAVLTDRSALMFPPSLARKPFHSCLRWWLMVVGHTDFTAHVTRRLLIIQSITRCNISINIDREIWYTPAWSSQNHSDL